MIAISIIVPVYNSEAYLAECLTSLFNQHFDLPYEIILIDDASSDSSAEIYTKFANDTPPGITFHYEKLACNSGVSKARNVGLSQVKGKYFCFVDSDDLLFENALAFMYSTAERHQACIVTGGHIKITDAGVPYEQKQKSRNFDAARHHQNALIELLKRKNIEAASWAKLYASEKYQELTVPENFRFAEDFAFNIKAFSLSEKVIIKNTPIYKYRQHPCNTSSNLITKKLYLDWISVVDETKVHATNKELKEAVIGLKLLTLLQIVRELRKNANQDLRHALNSLDACAKRWIPEIYRHPAPLLTKISAAHQLWRFKRIYTKLASQYPNGKVA